jgi:sporulation protein YlmC with PRC-barrel domain
MRPIGIMVVVSIALMSPTVVQAQVAGTTATQLRQVAAGWSVQRQVLGQSVYNDATESIGTVDDVIVGTDKSVSYAIIGVGGFLDMGKHDVAVPVNQLKQADGKFVLTGAPRTRSRRCRLSNTRIDVSSESAPCARSRLSGKPAH